ncbi:MAG TPA: hypothetical protein VJO35_09670 [Terriglobales bacterium]|nr:hypothetical protein [Terriglobales bacterium]
MSDPHAEEIVRTAVTEALERQIPSFRETIVQEVLRAVGPALGKQDHGGTGVAGLQKAIAVVQTGTTQKEILRALLDGTVLYCGRAALFVVKNGSATGWQGAGFSSDDAIKDFSLDVSSGLIARVMQSRTPENGKASHFDQNFISKFASPADGKILLLPLLLKDKVSALIYADSGPQGAAVDSAALDVLVKATSSWLEVVSQRKQAQREGGAEPEMHSAPQVNDPFAAHAPMHAAKAQHVPEEVPIAVAAAAGAGSSVATAPTLSPEEADVHRKAQRFARLLMDEIKLYNQAKVSEGRKNKDIYDRLKEDIEKSRNTYQKRYGNTSASSADYFNQELIRSLAGDDASLLGRNFPR